MSPFASIIAVTLGQVVLVVLVIALGVYVFALRSVLTDRLAMLLLATLGVVLVAWPGLSTDIAQHLGIGRGTDLVFYLFIIFCLFRFVSAAAHARRLDSRLASVVRAQAIWDARPSPGVSRSEATRDEYA
jgi:small membrane protein